MADSTWKLEDSILRRIVKHLDWLDVLNCFVIFSTWRSYIRSLRFPPLVMHTDDKIGFFRVMNAETDHSRCISLPEPIPSTYFFSSTNTGWLVAICREFPHEVHLLNPFTGTKIMLPSARNDFQDPSKLRVLTSTNPKDPECIFLLVAVTDSYRKQLAFCNKSTGYKQWRRNLNAKDESVLFTDGLFYNGYFYILTFAGDILRLKCDGTFPGVLKHHSIPPPAVFAHTSNKYLVESANGELLLVRRFCQYATRDEEDYEEHLFTTTLFVVYQFDWIGKEWLMVDSLGDQALFLSHNSSIAMPACTCGMECKANCIYFIGDPSEACTPKGYPNMFGVYDMETQEIYWLTWTLPVWASQLHWILPNI